VVLPVEKTAVVLTLFVSLNAVGGIIVLESAVIGLLQVLLITNRPRNDTRYSEMEAHGREAVRGVTYVISFNICELVSFWFFFRVTSRAYKLRWIRFRTRSPSSRRTRRNTLPRLLSRVIWLSKHAAQEVLVQQSRNQTSDPRA
jgi:hypothetical protein